MLYKQIRWKTRVKISVFILKLFALPFRVQHCNNFPLKNISIYCYNSLDLCYYVVIIDRIKMSLFEFKTFRFLAGVNLGPLRGKLSSSFFDLYLDRFQSKNVS